MHAIHRSLTRCRTPLRVAVVGIGGTGSDVLVSLLNIHDALRAHGRAGLDVHAFDPDTVSQANLARQRFHAPDLGRNKAEVLVRRINATTGTTWTAHARTFKGASARGTWDLVLSCVDTRASREALHRAAFSSSLGDRWHGWMDFGNEKDYGQVIYGEPGSRARTRLKCATELHPEIMDLSLPEDNTPSCSTLEALAKQDLFVNQIAARLGMHLLWKALLTGELPFQGYYFNLASGMTNALPVPGAGRTGKGGKKGTARLSTPAPTLAAA